MNDGFENAVEIWSDTDHCLPFVKGRVALYAILRAMGVGPGDEVLVPGFTCVVVPAAIMHVGATPRYYDIDLPSLQGAPDAAISLISERTRAVLVQHNFGSIAPTGDLDHICAEREIAIIEDCAHSLGAHDEDGPVGIRGAAAFCSFQWSKPTTTGLGGLARFNNSELAESARSVYDQEFSEPSRAKSIYLSILSTLYRSWYRPSWYWIAQDAYRMASRYGIIHGSSDAGELVSLEMPASYRERFGRIRESSLRAAIEKLPHILRHRREIARYFRRNLEGLQGWSPPAERQFERSASLRVPLLVENREELLTRARNERIELGDWFNAPLHPRGANPEVFCYSSGCCPTAEMAAARIINLPTHRRVDKNQADRILAFVKAHARITSSPTPITSTDSSST